MKNIFALALVIAFSFRAYAQPQKTLSIDECYALAKRHYPLVKQTALIQQSKEYNLENLSKGYLPQVNFAGQATYQSDVTKIPVKLPNLYIENPSKDQYKVYGEVNQILYDGGIIKQQKQLQEINAVVEQQKLETELYKLKERINQLFFGVLLIDEQLAQSATVRQDITAGAKKVEGALNNGAALKSSLDVLRAELLKVDQHEIELRSGRKAFLDMLGLFINQKLDENTAFEKPQARLLASTVGRPEIKLFDLQKKVFDVQNKMIDAKNLPRVGLFFQGGYGRPALNMLNNKFEAYYIGGIRINWSLAGFYTVKNDRQSLQVNKSLLDMQKETFVFNTNISLTQQNADINRIQELIKVDNQIILLRTSIKTTANAQLQYGTITSSDYIREVNAENTARESLVVHLLQLLMTQYSYMATAGLE